VAKNLTDLARRIEADALLGACDRGFEDHHMKRAARISKAPGSARADTEGRQSA
jgi:hypothetical protein